ncbi:MAG: cytochrome c, partial [Pseudomonadota bacterium]|nr:cytochrome c [Pseudomonadota bacterium]
MRGTFKNMHGLLVAFALAAICLASSPAHADGAGAIKYRQAVMASIGGHMRAMVAILRGSAGDPADLTLHAEGMAALAGLGDRLFPAGSGPAAGKTAALPRIWT